jgi:mRNA interferase MazF
MGSFVRGDVVILPFPFADRAGFKRRPALILSVFSAKEHIVCSITSQLVRDDFCIALNPEDFEIGGIKTASFIRPNYLFTVRSEIISYRAGRIQDGKFVEVVETINLLMSLG